MLIWQKEIKIIPLSHQDQPAIQTWVSLVKFEQNLMIQTIQNFERFDEKWLIIFDKVLTLF